MSQTIRPQRTDAGPRGSITSEHVDAIVTAANESLLAIAATTLRATPANVEQVRLVAFDEPTYELLQAALRA